MENPFLGLNKRFGERNKVQKIIALAVVDNMCTKISLSFTRNEFIYNGAQPPVEKSGLILTHLTST